MFIQKIKSLSRFQQISILIAALVMVGVAGALWITGDREKDAGTTAANCTPNAILVNPCRPWVGAAVGGYSMVAGDSNSQFNFLNKRINDASVLTNPSKSVAVNKRIDMAHVYHGQGSNLFSNSVKTVLNNKAIPQIFINWKPMPGGYKWKDAGGSNTTVNNYIKAGAQAVKQLGSRKIFLSVWHEPENDVSSGNCAANAAGASMGSPAEYVAMWRNVRKIFDQEGVNNVVWAMNYMGFPKWNCLVPKLWPGNDYVDWIVYDQYGSGTKTFRASVEPFYTYLSNNSNSTNNYLAKPWGLAEHGYGNAAGTSTESGSVLYWQQGKTFIEKNELPRIKMWLVFDISISDYSAQVGYTLDKKALNTAEQAAFNGFVGAILAKEQTTTAPPPPPGDTSAPSVSITQPAHNATVKGTITVAASASDNVGVTNVKLYVDNSLIKDDSNKSDGWSAQLNTANVSNGAHTLKAIARDAAGNTKTATVTINVANATAPNNPAPPAAPEITSFTASPSKIDTNQKSTLSWATKNVVTDGCNLNPSPLSNASTNGKWTTPALTSSKSYTLTCKNIAGATASKSVSVIVANQPAPPAPAPKPPAAPAPTTPTVRATTGETVSNASNTSSVPQGNLVTLEPSTVTDEAKVKSITKVEYYIDNKLYQTVTRAPFALSTTSMNPGEYSVTQKTYFDDGSMSEKTETIKVATKDGSVVPSSPGISPWLIGGGVILGISVLGGGGYVLWRYIMWRINTGI